MLGATVHPSYVTKLALLSASKAVLLVELLSAAVEYALESMPCLFEYRVES